jgi:hypothetical protein
MKKTAETVFELWSSRPLHWHGTNSPKQSNTDRKARPAGDAPKACEHHHPWIHDFATVKQRMCCVGAPSLPFAVIFLLVSVCLLPQSGALSIITS